MAYGSDPVDNPYAAPQEAIAPALEVGPGKFAGYGGFWIRFVAYFIDSILIGVVIGIPMNVLQFLIIGVPQPGAGGQPTALNSAALAFMGFSIIVSIAASVAYYAGMESSKYQATLGKMALGLQVVDLQGRRISFMRAVGRLAGKILSALICYIGFIMAGFSEKKQALHDLLAGTYVVKAAR
jgi:uncharacterized RDD family membrane protein YckC